MTGEPTDSGYYFAPSSAEDLGTAEIFDFSHSFYDGMREMVENDLLELKRIHLQLAIEYLGLSERTDGLGDDAEHSIAFHRWVTERALPTIRGEGEDMQDNEPCREERLIIITAMNAVDGAKKSGQTADQIMAQAVEMFGKVEHTIQTREIAAEAELFLGLRDIRKKLGQDPENPTDE